MGMVKMSLLTAGWGSRGLEPVEGARPGKVSSRRWSTASTPTGHRRSTIDSRQRAGLRPAGLALQPARARHRTQPPTSSPGGHRRQPGDLRSPPPTTSARFPSRSSNRVNVHRDQAADAGRSPRQIALRLHASIRASKTGAGASDDALEAVLERFADMALARCTFLDDHNFGNAKLARHTTILVAGDVGRRAALASRRACTGFRAPAGSAQQRQVSVARSATASRGRKETPVGAVMLTLV